MLPILSIASTCEIKYQSIMKNVYVKNDNEVIYYIRPYLQCDNNTFYRIIENTPGFDTLRNELCLRVGGHADQILPERSFRSKAFTYFAFDEVTKIQGYYNTIDLPNITYFYSYINEIDLFKKISKNVIGKQKKSFDSYEINNNFQPVPYSTYNGEVYVLQFFSCIVPQA